MASYFGTHYEAPVGDILLASDEANLVGLWIGRPKYIERTTPTQIVAADDLPVLNQAVGWLDDYFGGRQPALSRLPLAPVGGAFKQCVWQVMKEIPYGQLTTYGAIAKEVAQRMARQTMSAQAVGGAVGHNPISIIIPCHRVVGANGSLTGYAAGIDKKILLLAHEGVDLAALRPTW